MADTQKGSGQRMAEQEQALRSHNPQQNTTPSPSNYLLLIITRLLPLAGAAGGWAFAQAVTKQPGLQIIIAILCGLGGLLISFLNEVWQKLIFLARCHKRAYAEALGSIDLSILGWATPKKR